MLSFDNRASLLGVPTLPLDELLRSLLADVITPLEADGLLDLTHVLVVQPGDTEDDVAVEVGFSPLTDPYEGVRFGSPGFRPWWDLLRRRDGWYELVLCVADTGFAFVLLIQDHPDTEPGLLSLCRTYSEGKSSC